MNLATTILYSMLVWNKGNYFDFFWVQWLFSSLNFKSITLTTNYHTLFPTPPHLLFHALSFRGGQNRVTHLKPTDPCGSVWSGRVVSGRPGPGGSRVRFVIYIRVGSGCLHMTRSYPNPNRYIHCIIIIILML
jgi:hypothetical protein